MERLLKLEERAFDRAIEQHEAVPKYLGAGLFEEAWDALSLAKAHRYILQILQTELKQNRRTHHE